MRWYKENMQNRKITMHLLMVVLIMIWTLDAVAISVGVRNIPEMALLCMKYLAALPVILLRLLQMPSGYSRRKRICR